ncbi:hypothetical protein O7606_07930 [Micromonospora sp. WMMD882]|uniref:hypothetical protein n=1 Tax=Micromonospora sp. WMMD882 TaxID=3015151 RepID=UPI00248ADCD1|nr:hypothetical protein [Micromonospora sp. WMMD882]WBB81287.1 hypothetical protein O7606_07930 [Micromonospora sp. WMMD882]
MDKSKNLSMQLGDKADCVACGTEITKVEQGRGVQVWVDARGDAYHGFGIGGHLPLKGTVRRP